MPELLTEIQIASYQESGYLLLENHLPEQVIDNICLETGRFEDEARDMSASNERLELEEGHTSEQPLVRRIRLPHTMSDVVQKLMYSDHILACAWRITNYRRKSAMICNSPGARSQIFLCSPILVVHFPRDSGNRARHLTTSLSVSICARDNTVARSCIELRL